MLDLVNPLEPCGGWSSAELRQNKAKASNGGPTCYLAGLHRECEFSRRRVHTELAVSFLGYKVPARCLFVTDVRGNYAAKDKHDWSHTNGSSNAVRSAYIASSIRFVLVSRQRASLRPL